MSDEPTAPAAKLWGNLGKKFTPYDYALLAALFIGVGAEPYISGASPALGLAVDLALLVGAFHAGQRMIGTRLTLAFWLVLIGLVVAWLALRYLGLVPRYEG